jgi:hypothetical protein
MDRLEVYDKVNQCETLEQLAEIIESLASEDGFIQGRTRGFNAEKMVWACLNYDKMNKNVLTREFGIRQQAMYILYYTRKG